MPLGVLDRPDPKRIPRPRDRQDIVGADAVALETHAIGGDQKQHLLRQSRVVQKFVIFEELALQKHAAVENALQLRVEIGKLRRLVHLHALPGTNVCDLERRRVDDRHQPLIAPIFERRSHLRRRQTQRVAHPLQRVVAKRRAGAAKPQPIQIDLEGVAVGVG